MGSERAGWDVCLREDQSKSQGAGPDGRALLDGTSDIEREPAARSARGRRACKPHFNMISI
jgi:hypothetical protein